jgi:hypothetical protein
VKFIENLNLRGKILVPTISLIVVALVVMGSLARALSSTSSKYQDLMFGPRLAAKVSLGYAGQLSAASSTARCSTATVATWSNSAASSTS